MSKCTSTFKYKFKSFKNILLLLKELNLNQPNSLCLILKQVIKKKHLNIFLNITTKDLLSSAIEKDDPNIHKNYKVY